MFVLEFDCAHALKESIPILSFQVSYYSQVNNNYTFAKNKLVRHYQSQERVIEARFAMRESSKQNARAEKNITDSHVRLAERVPMFFFFSVRLSRHPSLSHSHEERMHHGLAHSLVSTYDEQ